MSVTGVVVGNPKPRSRTYQAALLVAQRLSGAEPGLVVDLADLGAGLLDPDDDAASQAVKEVRALDLLIVASPTYKGAYTGLLKLFLDRFPSNALSGVVAVPLMLGVRGPVTHWRRRCISSRSSPNSGPRPRPARCTCSTPYSTIQR